MAKSGTNTVSEAAALDRVLADSAALDIVYRESLSNYRALPDSLYGERATSELGRIYDRLAASESENGLRAQVMNNPFDSQYRCAYCEIVESHQMDHFLPKSLHAEFALETLNLIPVCGRCNQKKLALTIGASGERLPHPYIDAYIESAFLKVTVLCVAGAVSARYDLDFSGDFDARVEDSVRRLFARLALLSRYEFEGNTILRELSYSLPNLRDQRALAEWASRETGNLTRQYGHNHWKTALHQGIAVGAATGTLDPAHFLVPHMEDAPMVVNTR